jgi:hypothetical protein
MNVPQPRFLVGEAPSAAGVAPGARLAPRWVARLFAVAAVLLLPWVVLLVVALPSTHRATHWDIAWVGFDVMLVLLLLTVAATAWRGSPWLEGAATATATLLFVDAWFDVLTSSTRTEFVAALVEAAFVELPLAILCLLLAREAKRHLEPQRSPAPFAPPRLALVRGHSEVELPESEARRTA